MSVIDDIVAQLVGTRQAAPAAAPMGYPAPAVPEVTPAMSFMLPQQQARAAFPDPRTAAPAPAAVPIPVPRPQSAWDTPPPPPPMPLDHPVRIARIKEALRAGLIPQSSYDDYMKQVEQLK